MSFTATNAVFAQCGASSSCTLYTNSTGTASSSITPSNAGPVILRATGRSGSVTVNLLATGGPDVLLLLGSPAGIATVGAVAPLPLRAQLLAADGVTPRVGSAVTLSVTSGTAALSGCVTNPCSAHHRRSRNDHLQGDPHVHRHYRDARRFHFELCHGELFRSSRDNPIEERSSRYTDRRYVDSKSLPGESVWPATASPRLPVRRSSFTAAGGTVNFGVCGGGVCTLTTDSLGLAQSTVTPLSAATIKLNAMGNAGAVSASFVAVAPPDGFHLVSAPSGNVYVGDAASTPFSVRITAADGVNARGRQARDLHSLRRRNPSSVHVRLPAASSRPIRQA